LFLEEELDFWILRLLQKGWEKFSRTVQQTNDKLNKAIFRHIAGLGVTEELVDEILNKSDLINKKITEWTEQDLMKIGREIRRKTKPMIIAANKCDFLESFENIKKMKEKYPNYIVIPCSGDSWQSG